MFHAVTALGCKVRSGLTPRKMNQAVFPQWIALPVQRYRAQSCLSEKSLHIGAVGTGRSPQGRMDLHYQAQTPATPFDCTSGAAESCQLESLDVDQYPIGLEFGPCAEVVDGDHRYSDALGGVDQAVLLGQAAHPIGSRTIHRLGAGGRSNRT